MMTLNKPAHPLIPPEAKTEAAMAHICGALLLFAGPLSIWLFKRAQSAFGAKALMESLNWQVYVTAAFVITLPLSIHVAGYLALFSLVYSIYAAFCCSRGLEFRFNLPYRFFA